MKRAIWKYILRITDRQNVMMPEGAEILTVQVQRQEVCLWALVNPSAPKQPRDIEILGTGNPAADAPRRYIATVQTNEERLVWHVFERDFPITGRALKTEN